jgi:hypothetical protein
LVVGGSLAGWQLLDRGGPAPTAASIGPTSPVIIVDTVLDACTRA